MSAVLGGAIAIDPVVQIDAPVLVSSAVIADADAVVIPVGGKQARFLTDVSALADGDILQMVIEISEDGGNTWYEIGSGTYDNTILPIGGIGFNLEESNGNPNFLTRVTRNIASSARAELSRISPATLVADGAPAIVPDLTVEIYG